MSKYLFIFLIFILYSCEPDKKSVTKTDPDQSRTDQNVKIDSVHQKEPEPKELKIEEAIQIKKEEKAVAQEQLELDTKNSKLKSISCIEIFVNYKKLILQAKSSGSKEDIERMNEYRRDPNFNKCRKAPENKEMYNSLEKLKRSN